MDGEALTDALHLSLQICVVANPADALLLVQALSQVHAAGVCLLDISAESIWLTAAGSATFLDFSMAHEFIPGEAEHVCALQLTQQHVAPEVLRARLTHDISGRLAPFSGPKVHTVLFLEVSCCTCTACRIQQVNYTCSDSIITEEASRSLPYLSTTLLWVEIWR